MSDEYFDNLEKRNQDMKWIEDIIEKGGCCHICFNSDDPLILDVFELHHIGKGNNSDITITVCPTCHKKLSLKQLSWDGESCNQNNPFEKKIAFYLRGRSEVLKMMADKDKKFSDKILKGDDF